VGSMVWASRLRRLRGRTDRPAPGGGIAAPDHLLGAPSLVVFVLLPAAIFIVSAAPIVFFLAAPILVLTHASGVLFSAAIVLALSIVTCHRWFLSCSAGNRRARRLAGQIPVMPGESVNDEGAEREQVRVDHAPGSNGMRGAGIGGVAPGMSEIGGASWSSCYDARGGRRSMSARSAIRRRARWMVAGVVSDGGIMKTV